MSVMNGLGTLPPEILRTTADFLLPGTLYDLALTCKRVYQCLHHLLQAQQEFAKKYSSVDTRHPLNAVTALRRILTDPTAAWHLRSINIWRVPWRFEAWNDLAGQDDVDFLPSAVRYPHLWASPAYKQIYKRLRQRWRDYTYLGYGVGPAAMAEPGAASRNEAFVSEKEIDILETLLGPFTPKMHNHSIDLGGGCRALFLLVACAPRLRHVWHARPDETLVPWHTYIRKFFIRRNLWVAEQQSLLSSRDWPAKRDEFQRMIPPGLSSLRCINLEERPPFFKSERNWAPLRMEVVIDFLSLPNLELLRFVHPFPRSELGFEDLDYIFEWEPKNGTLRESLMTFTDEEEPFRPSNGWQYWPMRTLFRYLRGRIVNYECFTGVLHNVELLHRHSAETLESLTFTDNTPGDLGYLLGEFPNLKTLTVGIDYLSQSSNTVYDELAKTVLLPASLEHLMVHSDSHVKKRPTERSDRRRWTETMNDLGSQLVSNIFHMLILDHLPKLRSLCILQIWGGTNPDYLDLLTKLAAQRHLCLHLWSGSLDPDARTCRHLCGRFVPTERENYRWPDGPRSWNYFSTYNWITSTDEVQYGSRYLWSYPPLDDDAETTAQFLEEWDEKFFEHRLSELSTKPDEVGGLVELNLAEDGLDFLDPHHSRLLIDALCERYKVREDKARKAKESMDLGRQVIDQLGGDGGRLVCENFTWQRVYD